MGTAPLLRATAVRMTCSVSVNFFMGLAPSGFRTGWTAGSYEPKPRDKREAERHVPSHAPLRGVFTFLEGGVGDALQEFGIVFEVADVPPME